MEKADVTGRDFLTQILRAFRASEAHVVQLRMYASLFLIKL